MEVKLKTSEAEDGPAMVPNDGMKLRVEELVKLDLFQMQKFLANEAQLLIACTFIAKRTSEYQDYKDKPKKAQKVWFKKFTACYGGVVTKTLNDKRSYVQQNLKKVYFALWKDGKKAPTAKELLRLALRKDLLDVPAVKAVKAKAAVEGEDGEDDIPAVEAVKAVAAVDNSANRSAFEFYWVEILGRVAGNHYWGRNQKFYSRISTSYPTGETVFKNIPSCTEAAVVLFIENCIKRWEYLWKCKQDGTDIDKKHEDFDPVFSDACSGQQKFGGWKSEGRVRLKDLKDWIG